MYSNDNTVEVFADKETDFILGQLSQNPRAVTSSVNEYGVGRLSHLIKDTSLALDARFIQQCLQRGLDPNIQDSEASDKPGSTALHWAIHYNRPLAIIQTLLNNGARIDIKDAQNRTAVDVARNYGRTDILETLPKCASNFSSQSSSANIVDMLRKHWFSKQPATEVSNAEKASLRSVKLSSSSRRSSSNTGAWVRDPNTKEVIGYVTPDPKSKEVSSFFRK